MYNILGKVKLQSRLKIYIYIRGFFFCITIVLLAWIQYVNLQQFLFYTDTQIHSIGVFIAPELIYCNVILCVCRNLNIGRVEVRTG